MGFARAVWLGKSYDTDEHICALETGELVATRTVKRLPEERRFNRTAVAAITHVPWQRRGQGGTVPRGIEPIITPPAAADADLATQEAAEAQPDPGAAAQSTGAAHGGGPASQTGMPMAAPSADVAGGAEAPAGDRQAGPATQTSAGGGAGDDTPMTPRAAAPACVDPQTPLMGRSPKRPAEE
eukprot:5171585-Pyramimonas_sp.AAC.1